VDEFIAQLWKVHLDVKERGYTQVSEEALFSKGHMLIKNRTSLWDFLDQITWFIKAILMTYQ